MNAILGREIRLASRPHGMPSAGNFTLVDVELPPPSEGQVLVRNLYLSIDPAMRILMSDAKSYMAPIRLGETPGGAAVGEVVASRTSRLAPGDIVTSWRGWREYFVADAGKVRAVDGSVRPLSLHLGVLGVTGMTAWIGLKLTDLKADDCVFISAAAGATGSVAGQLARLKGCRVVGSAGSPRKVKVLLEDLGFHAAFNYKDGDLQGQLSAAAPGGDRRVFRQCGR